MRLPRVSVQLVALALSLGATVAEERHWPSFRGPGGSAVVEGWSAPTDWDVAAVEGVLWRTPVPGLSHSSPVVHGDRLFLTTAVSTMEAPLSVGRWQTGLTDTAYGATRPVPDEGPHVYRVLCLDKRSGEVLWSRVAHEGKPSSRRHSKSSHAAPTAAVDAERVIASFGPEGLFAYDHDGRLLWKRALGELRSGYYKLPENEWGYASSPALHEGFVIVQCDVFHGAFLAAFDAVDGRELWRAPRHEVPTWSSPIVVETADGPQVVVNGHLHMGGYDLETGGELWRLSGGADLPVPTPTAADGLLFLTSGHGLTLPVFAIRADAAGRVECVGPGSEHVAWSRPQGGSDIASPIAYRGRLYVLNNAGVLAEFDAVSGERLNRIRLGGGPASFSASPVATGGRIYFTTEEGQVFVVGVEPEAELVAISDLGEICMASPAISEGVLYFRTRHHVVALGSE